MPLRSQLHFDLLSTVTALASFSLRSGDVTPSSVVEEVPPLPPTASLAAVDLRADPVGLSDWETAADKDDEFEPGQLTMTRAMANRRMATH